MSITDIKKTKAPNLGTTYFRLERLEQGLHIAIRSRDKTYNSEIIHVLCYIHFLKDGPKNFLDLRLQDISYRIGTFWNQFLHTVCCPAFCFNQVHNF